MRVPAYWINGFFYQEGQQFLFGGIIQPVEGRGELVGEMHDQFGSAVLQDIVLTKNDLTFTKDYTTRGYHIHYRLRKEGECWAGTYSGTFTGTDIVRCTLTEIPVEMFVQPG